MERSFTSPFFPFLRAKRSKRNGQSDAILHQDIRLSFDTQRVQKAKSLEPVEAILCNASYTQEMSFQPTVRVQLRQVNSEFSQGATLANHIGKMDFRKSQALMFFSISGMGLMIGILISFIL